jgi:hypothetical protein
MARVSSAHRITVPSHVLARELDGESVLLNLDSSCFFGLDAIGTHFWATLCAATSTEAAYQTLLATYEVGAERLRHDLEHLIDALLQHGLVNIHGHDDALSRPLTPNLQCPSDA